MVVVFYNTSENIHNHSVKILINVLVKKKEVYRIIVSKQNYSENQKFLPI